MFKVYCTQEQTAIYLSVTRYVRRLRQAQRLQLRQVPRHRLYRTVVARQRKVLTARRAAWLVLRRLEN